MSKDEVHDQKSFKFLSQFLARYDPDGAFRDDLDIYERLTNNDVRFLRTRIAAPPSATQKFEDPWPQRKMYTAEQWLELYRRYKPAVDTKAQEFQQRWAEADGKHGPLKPVSSSQRKKQQSSAVPSTPRSTQRTPFTPKDDANLIQWLAIEHPAQKGRKSAALYERLMFDTTLWPWARRHPADSWRERYRKNTTRLDRAIEKYQQNHGIDPVDPRDHTDKHPRHDIWAKVPGLSAVEDSPRSQPGSSSQNDKVASTSKQTPAPVKPPNTKHTPVSQETRREGRAEAQDIVPRHSERAQEKHRVLPHGVNAEEEEEEEEPQKQRQREDDELPVLLESPEEEADDYAEEIARDPGVEDDEAGPMEEDQHAQTSDHQERPIVLQNSNNDFAQSDPREPDAEDVRETEELVDIGKQPLWAILPQDGNETEAEEDEEVDELDPSPQPDSPQVRKRNRRKKPQPAVPQKLTQEPTPPTSDSLGSPTRPHHEPLPADPPRQPSQAPVPAPLSPPLPSRTVLRKRRHEEIFTDFEEEAATSTPRPTKRAALLTYREGFFNTVLADAGRPGEVFKNGRRISGVHELPRLGEDPSGTVLPTVAVEWPPKRGKRAAKAAAPAEASVVRPVPEPEPALAPVGSQYNPFAEPSQRVEGEDIEEVEVEEEVTVASSSRSGVSVSPPAKRVESVAPTEILPGEVEDLRPRSRQKSAVRRSMPPPPEPPVTRRASRHAPETSFRPEVLKGKGRAFDPPAPEAEPSMMRRHTFVDAGRPLVSRRAGMWPRHSLPAAISRPPMRASSRRSSMVVDGIPLSEQDQRAMVKVGLDVTLQQKAAQSGFAPDVVRHAFRAVGKLDLLDRWLREMTNNVSTTAQRVALRLVKEEEALSRSGYYDDDDGEEDEGSAGSSELEREPETSWSEEQSSVYYPPDNSRAADLLRAEAERQRLGEAGSSRGASGRREEPAPAPSGDPRMNFAQQILGKLRHR